jgi:hypothetical protein
MGRADKPVPEEAAARRRFVALPLAQLVPDLTRPAFRKHSPAGAGLMAEWAAIVGPALAATSQPRRLSRGQLTIACAGAVAMELQHLQAALIDRINAHAGQKLVEKLRFTQDLVLDRPASGKIARKVGLERVEGVAGPLADALAALLQSIRERG